MKCNMQHSAITCTCCVLTKMPHSGPNYFVRSLDTLGQSGTWRNRWVSHRHASGREYLRHCGCWRLKHLGFEPLNFVLEFPNPGFKVINLRLIQPVLSLRFPKLLSIFIKRGIQSRYSCEEVPRASCSPCILSCSSERTVSESASLCSHTR